MRHLELLETLDPTPVQSGDWYSRSFVYTILHLIDCRIGGADGAELVPGFDAAERIFQRAASATPHVPTLRALARQVRSWLLDDRAEELMPALLDHIPYLVDEELWETVRSISNLVFLLGGETIGSNIEWQAYRSRAMYHRHTGDLALASINYQAGAEAARRGESEEGIVANEAGLAVTTRHRGNLPAAETQLRGLLARAESTGKWQVITHVRSELAVVLGERHQFDECLFELDRALLTANARERERITCNIANTCFLTGHLQAAGELYAALLTSAKSVAVRFMARANCIRIAAVGSNLGEVERLHAKLEPEHCAVVYRIEYLLALGSSYATLGERRRAEDALRECIELSSEVGMGQRLIDAERELAHVKHLSRLNRQVDESPELVDAIVDNARRSLVG